MDKDINNNGFEYVDLGLPSGTLWATKNVGSHKPSDFGLYFQWGHTIGYTKNEIGEDKQFTWNDYKWNPSGDGETFTKYTNPRETLELEDDAAHANMGGDWHMPTPKQCQELIDNTTRVWTILDGVGGMKFTSKNDESRFIFIPVAGMAWDSLVDTNEYNGNVWTSMVSTTDIDGAQSLFFDFGTCCLGNGGRRSYGFSVRGVIDKNNDSSKEKTRNMNENLNLVKVLKDAPKGTKLWSPICGECEFQYIDNNAIYLKIVCSVVGKNGKNMRASFTKDGWFSDSFAYAYSECVLFPSKENRDWSTFKAPNTHKHFEPFQKVLRVTGINPNHKIWIADFYSHYDEATGKHYLTSDFIRSDDEIMPYEGNEDKVGKEAK